MDEPTEPTAAQPPALPPYVIEGARSGRSKCKTCRRAIPKGSLRIGFFIEGPFGTGYLWHHLTCAARRHFERVEEAYGLEAWKEAKEPPGKLPDLEELRQAREKADERKRTKKEIPYAEVAPTGRAKCKHCGEPIEQGSIRITVGREIEFGNQVRTAPVNVHPRCVAAEINSPESATPAEGLFEAVRAQSGEIPSEALEAALGEIGDLD